MSEVERYYDTQTEREWRRAERHPLEFAIVQRALLAHLPPPPASILDIGGGPGRYSIWLTRLGYRVTLADLSQASLDWAQQEAVRENVQIAKVLRADATDLGQFVADEFDAVLLMGPLYHLVQLAQRERARDEACRVCKPGGIVAAAFISLYGILAYEALNDPEWIARSPEERDSILQHGFQKDAGGSRGFTTAYFARPDEVLPFMRGAPLDDVAFLSCEGVSNLAGPRLYGISPEAWERWVDVNYAVAFDPAALGAAGHFLYIGRKQP